MKAGYKPGAEQGGGNRACGGRHVQYSGWELGY